jgi:hypothetical protein
METAKSAMTEILTSINSLQEIEGVEVSEWGE